MKVIIKPYLHVISSDTPCQYRDNVNFQKSNIFVLSYSNDLKCIGIFCLYL